MVQVDVFWSYSLGAGFAFAASRQLKQMKDARERPEADKEISGPFINSYFIWAVIYVACFFAPSGVYLLWNFASWETMHVLNRNMSALLVTAFAVTNVTQGVLGFWITYKFIKGGNGYGGFLQILLGYFFMFFILVHGWDGKGYQRFFSATREGFLNWDVANLTAWFTSDVAIALYVMGVCLLPFLFYLMARWLKEGYEIADDVDPERAKNMGQVKIVVLLNLLIFGCGLIPSICASLLIHKLGWIIGAAVALPAIYFVCVRRGGLFHIVYRALTLEEARA